VRYAGCENSFAFARGFERGDGRTREDVRCDANEYDQGQIDNRNRQGDATHRVGEARRRFGRAQRRLQQRGILAQDECVCPRVEGQKNDDENDYIERCGAPD
jgi:hypothetical protein